jgi:hypothetical protein
MAPSIHRAVVLLDPIEHGADHLDRRQLLASKPREQLRDRQEGDGIPGCCSYDESLHP